MGKTSKIKQRLKQFKSLSEEQQFREFQFCLLTPQSNAQRCWQAVEDLTKLKKPTLKQITSILKTKTRFHNTKAKRILNAKDAWQKISAMLKGAGKMRYQSTNLASNKRARLDQRAGREGAHLEMEIPQLRNEIAKTVNGYGLKEASHFLRNIGLSNNSIAILDRHILKNLGVEKITSRKHYLEIEQKFLKVAKSKKIPADELDLLWWSQENGEVFK